VATTRRYVILASCPTTRTCKRVGHKLRCIAYNRQHQNLPSGFRTPISLAPNSSAFYSPAGYTTWHAVVHPRTHGFKNMNMSLWQVFHGQNPPRQFFLAEACCHACQKVQVELLPWNFSGSITTAPTSCHPSPVTEPHQHVPCRQCGSLL